MLWSWSSLWSRDDDDGDDDGDGDGDGLWGAPLAFAPVEVAHMATHPAVQFCFDAPVHCLCRFAAKGTRILNSGGRVGNVWDESGFFLIWGGGERGVWGGFFSSFAAKIKITHLEP